MSVKDFNRLSIIFVYYHTRDFLLECLEKIALTSTGLNYEVIVADNGSAPGDGEFFTDKFPQLRWISMNGNFGFSRGNNAGIKIAKGDAILLLNTDTLPDGQTILSCYNRLMHADDVVAAGVQLEYPDNTPQISGSYFILGGINYLLPLPVTGYILKKAAGLFGKKAPHLVASENSTEVDWINGAFLMVKKKSIDFAGLMDEEFFLYAEEGEWCYRLKKTGKLVVFGDLHVVHLEGLSSKRDHGDQQKGYYELNTKRGLQLMVSNILRIRKQYGKGWYLLMLASYSLEVIWWLILGLIKALFGSTKLLNGWIGFTNNIYNLWKLFPKMFFCRPWFYKMY
jgi:GT2 family glycosyltransferase